MKATSCASGRLLLALACVTGLVSASAYTDPQEGACQATEAVILRSALAWWNDPPDVGCDLNPTQC